MKKGERETLIKVLSELASLVESGNNKSLCLADILLHPILSSPSRVKHNALSKFVFRIKRSVVNFVLYVKDKSHLEKVDVVLFVTEPTHVNQLAPIAKKLVLRNVKIAFITNRIPLYRSLRKRNLSTLFSYRPFATGKKKFLLDHGKELGEYSFPKLEELSNEAAILGSYLEDALEKLEPSYIFVGNDITWEGRLCARIAKGRGIATGMVQHGLMSNDPLNRFHIVDQHFVYGEASFSILRSARIPAERIWTVGAPYLDEIEIQNVKEPHSFLVDRFSIRSQFTLVALSGHGHKTSLENYEKSIEWILALIQEDSESDVVIKLHRKETKLYYNQIAQRMDLKRDLNIVDRSDIQKQRNKPDNIFQWLRGCACVVTGTSTVAIEAMLLGIPVISIDPLKEFEGIDFIEQGAVTYCTTYEEFAKAYQMRKLSKPNTFFIEKIFINAFSRNASDRVLAQMNVGSK